MGKWFNGAVFIFLGFSATAQTQQETNKITNSNISNSAKQNAVIVPEITSPSRDVRSNTYYRTEAAEFEQQARLTPTSAQAWLNLYKSSLYSCYSGSSKTITARQKEELDDIVVEMKNNIPGTFEYNLAVYLNGQHNTSLIPYLMKAGELNGNNLDVVEQYVAYYAITGNAASFKAYVNKHRKLAGYEAFVDEYAYNLLQSLESNAVLFTHGIMDTYPVYYQQLNQKVNSGVYIINIDYLNSEEFRKVITQKLGIAFTYNGNNYAAAFDIAAKIKNSRSVYFSNAFSKNDLKKHAAELELCGLALKYGSNNTDGARLATMWSSKFKKQLLEKAAMKDDYAKKMANNYQPMLVTLYTHYKSQGNTAEAGKIKALALKIARINGSEKQVNDILN